MAKPLIRIEMMGRLQVVWPGAPPQRFPSDRPGMLLAYLATAHRDVGREEVIDLFWPDADLESGRNRLKQTVFKLRSLLDERAEGAGEVVGSDREILSLDFSSVSTDLEEFQEWIRRAQTATERGNQIIALTSAVGLYRGEFLQGCYEEWLLSTRRGLEATYSSALNELSSALERIGNFDESLDFARKAVLLDPLREDAHCRIMHLCMSAGRRLDAMRQYKELERILEVELGIQPSDATKALLEQCSNYETRSANTGNGPTQRDSAPEVGHDEEPILGAVPLTSEFYIERDCDAYLKRSMSRGDSIVLVKGPRQVGKTSLLARGIKHSVESQLAVVVSDLQKLNREDLNGVETLYRALGRQFADQLNLKDTLDDHWDHRRGGNENFERFVRRQVLSESGAKVVWCLDEVDRLFGYDYSCEVFSMFRSWHNGRSLDIAGPWRRLTLVIAYATEAHLFITDLNQSPFNIGTRIALDDFTLEQTAELNRRHGSPIKDAADLVHFQSLTGGNPFLAQRGLQVMSIHNMSEAEFELASARDDGPYRDALWRMLTHIQASDALLHAVTAVISGSAIPDSDSFYRLRSAGVLSGNSPQDAKLRCELYRRFLSERLEDLAGSRSSISK